MRKTEQDFKKVVLRLAKTNERNFLNSLRWKKIVKILAERPELVDALALIATDKRNVYSHTAQEVIALSWWNSMGTEVEPKRFSLLFKTKSHAEAGQLRIITHVIHNDLENLFESLNISEGKFAPKSPHVVKFLQELEGVISQGDNWSLELINQIGNIASTKNSYGNLFHDLLWKLYFKSNKPAKEILSLCKQKSLLPDAGPYMFLSAAVLSPSHLEKLVNGTNVELAVRDLISFFEKDDLVRLSLLELIECAKDEVLDYFWDLWHQKSNQIDAQIFAALKKNKSVPSLKWVDRIWNLWYKSGVGAIAEYEDLLKRWAIPFTKTDSSDLLLRHLRAESIGFLGQTELLDDDNPILALEILQYICLSKVSQVRSKANSIVNRKNLTKTREEMCNQALNNKNIKKLCIDYKVAPTDEVKRSVFFLATDQIQELKMLDPDLDLLGIAYLSENENQRAMIRSALLKSPSLSFSQVISGFNRRDRLARMTVEEVEYFIDRLFERQEFDSILEMAVNMSLAVFIWSINRIFDKDFTWIPADPGLAKIYEDAHRLIANLPSLRTKERDSRSVLSQLFNNIKWPVGVRSARISFDGRINDIAFSPDGKFLAVAGTNKIVGEVDLSLGKLSFVVPGFSSSVGNLLHLGNHSVLAGERTNSPEKLCRVLSVEKGGRPKEIVSIVQGSVTSLVKFGENGAAFTGRNGTLGLISLKGKPREISTMSLGNNYPRLAAENSTGLSGVFFNRNANYFTWSNKKISLHNSIRLQSVAKRATWITTNKVEKVVYLSHSGVVKVIDVDTRNFTISENPTRAYAGPQTTDMVLLPNRNQIALLSDSRLSLISIDDLKSQGELGYGGKSLHGSPDGSLIAIGDEAGRLQLIDTSISFIPALFSKPIASSTPRDFQTCMRAESSIFSKTDGEFLAMKCLITLQLLLLQYRFRHDISLVDSTVIRMGEYDISLG